MKKLKSLLISILSFCAIVCFTISGGVGFANSETNEAPFESVKIIGSSARLDDTGIRFTLEMNSKDFKTFSTGEYTMGILVFPTVGLDGGELNINTQKGEAKPENIVFEKEYSPKLVNTEGVVTYRFNGALTNIPKTHYEITARAYIIDGSDYLYTNSFTSTVSRVSADIYGMAEYADYNATLESNIIEAYNEVVQPEVDATTINDIENGINLDFNSVNSLIVGDNNVEGYSNEIVLPEDLDKVFDYTLTSSDKNVVAVDAENKLTAKKYGNAEITLTAIGKTIGTVKAYAMDSDLVKMGYSGVSSTHSTADARAIDADNAGKKKDWNWAEDKKAYMNQVANSFLNENIRISSVNANTSKVWWNNTECTWEDDAKYGKVITGYNAGGSGENVNTFMFNTLYTKEQIAMFMACGYDVINIPVKLNVSEETINGSVLNGRNYIGVYVPTERITGKNVAVGFSSKCDMGYFRVNKLFFNEWQEITISLKTLYDNFDQMLYFNGSADGTNFPTQSNYATRKYAWFALENKTYGDNADATFAKTITFADVYLSKASDSESETAVNLNSNEFNEGVRAWNTSDDTFATSDTQYSKAGSVMGRAQTTITDKNNVSKTANFVYMMNSKYDRGFQTGLTVAGNGIPESKIYLTIGKTKAELQALADAGYKYLTIDVCFKLDADLRSDTSTTLYTVNTLRAGKDDGTDSYSSIDFNTWATWKISIQGMIAKYDALFNNTGSNRRQFILSRTNDASTTYAIYTLYMTGFEFTKA